MPDIGNRTFKHAIGEGGEENGGMEKNSCYHGPGKNRLGPIPGGKELDAFAGEDNRRLKERKECSSRLFRDVPEKRG